MLKNKKIMVVGASRGIGEAIAYAYAKEGADLVLTGRNAKTLEPVAEKCRAMGVQAHILEWDVADVERADEMMAKAAELILETDRQMKTSYDDPDRLLELLILRLGQEARNG